MRGPAIALIVSMVQATVLAIGSGVQLLHDVYGSSDESLSGFWVFVAVIEFVLVPLWLVSIVGAIQMLRLKNYRLARLSCRLAYLPGHPFWLVTLIIGIWAARRLRQPVVKMAFGKK